MAPEKGSPMPLCQHLVLAVVVLCYKAEWRGRGWGCVCLAWQFHNKMCVYEKHPLAGQNFQC